MENMKFCQSCGMPMGQTDEMYGLNSDGSKSEDYCKYCYVNGGFNKEDETLEEMIETCIPFMVKEGISAEKARKMLVEQLPTLKRWRKI